MKILITGGAGFIGSHIAEHYTQNGAEVFIFDNLSRAQYTLKKGTIRDYNWNYLENYPSVARIPGDIRDFEALEAAAKDVEIIFNCAAQTQINASIADPIEDISTNIMGTFNILELARRLPQKPIIIHCSTSRVYGVNVNRLKFIEDGDILRFDDNSVKNGISEDFPLDGHGHTPFGASKLAVDIYMQEYAHLYGLKIGVFRLSTIYGTRQFGLEEQGWIARLLLDTLLGRPIAIYGAGTQTRDPLFVTDMIAAFEAFIESEIPQGVFNLGGGMNNLLSPLRLLEILTEKTGARSAPNFHPPQPYDQRIYCADISKARKLLNWKPAVPISQGLDFMIEWVNENKNLFS